MSECKKCYDSVTNRKDKRFRFRMLPYDMLLVPYIVCLLKPIKIFLIVYRVGNKTVKSEYLKIFAKNIKKCLQV